MPDSSTVNIQSMISTKPDVKDNSITIPFVKDGTTAFNGAGTKFTITSEALENDHATWQGGIVTVNHKVKEQGLISKTWYDSPFAYAEITGLSDEAMSIVQSPAYRGVSQESTSITTDKKGNVTKLKGTGITLVVYPEKPACDMGAGCGELIASALVGSYDDEYIKVDVAVKNNSGRTIKIRDETVYLEQNEMQDVDLFEQRLANNIGYMGLGTYYIFEHDAEMKIGDEYPGDIEPTNTVEITVSTDESNPHLNTQNSNLELTSTRGTELMTDETDKGALEALKTENEALKTKSTALDSEIADLKSQLVESGKLKDTEITDLKSTIKVKDDQIAKSADNLETAIKSALEAHDASITEKQAFEVAVTELKSVMKDETSAEFLETKPSTAQIMSMVKALKSTSSAQVGAGSGGDVSTGEKTIEDQLQSIGIPSIEFIGGGK